MGPLTPCHQLLLHSYLHTEAPLILMDEITIIAVMVAIYRTVSSMFVYPVVSARTNYQFEEPKPARELVQLDEITEQNLGTAAIASSSSSFAAFHPKKHDVFISFRGEDTRCNFISHLRDALRGKGIETYMDDKLNRGDDISPALFEAIKESHISIIVLSENYASSKWCLEELVKILECKKNNGQDVIPVFYHVDPSHVRKQTGSYKKAFAKLKRDFEDNQHKLTEWKRALTEAANLAGWDPQVYGDESKLIHEIVKDVLSKLQYKYPPMESTYPFGFNENLAPIESLLSKVQTIGIWGMGGIGKTTIAKWIFDKYSSPYEGSCFLPNIRENSQKHGLALDDLRKKLVADLLNEDERTIKVESALVKCRLCHKRVFIVLDDVSSSEHLEHLVRELKHCGSGSKIIITTRDKHVLSKGVDAIHTVEALNFQESFQLFCLKAFNENHPMIGYEELSQRAVGYAKGMPLALEVLGSFLRSKTEDEWESALKKLRRIPNEKIQSILRLSYDGLDDKEREIFLDIACFLKGKNKKHVISLLDSYDFYANIGLRSLQDRALITIEGGVVWMHDLIQEMGWEIVRQESIKEPGRRSRLGDLKEVCDVLRYNRGTDAIEGIILDMTEIEEIDLNVDTFNKMTNIRFFRFYSSLDVGYSRVHLPSGLRFSSNRLRYFEWDGYPSKSLPSTFYLEKLVELRMQNSCVKKPWDGVQDFVNLKIIDFTGSKWLTELPDFSKASNLEEVDLSHCESLCHVHPSLLSLHSLIVLNLYGCKGLESLETEIHLRSLTHLNVGDCSSLKRFSVSSEKIYSLDLYGLGIEMLPSFTGLSKLTSLSLWSLTLIEDLPSELSCLRNLRKLGISNIPRLMVDKQKLHRIFDGLQSLEKLYFIGIDLLELPDNIKQLTRLRSMYLQDCKRIRFSPELPQSIRKLSLNGSSIECLPTSIQQLIELRRLDLSECKMLQSLPELPQSIEDLSLFESSIECLPANVHQLTKLRCLHLGDCKSLRTLTELPQSITRLYAGNCTSLERVIITRRTSTLWKKGDALSVWFENCTNLDEDAVSTILEDFHSSIKQSADEMAVTGRLADYFKQRVAAAWKFGMCLPGSRVPEWFKDNRATEASITIKLDRPSQLVAFAFCVVLPPDSAIYDHGISVKYHQGEFASFKEAGLNDPWNWAFYIPGQNCDHVYLWCYPTYSFSDKKTTCNTTFSFEAHPVSDKHIKIKECGVYPVYVSEGQVSLAPT